MADTPPTGPQLDQYETAARNAARIGSGIDPAAVLELAAEVRRQRAVIEAEKSAHLFTLRQRNNRSQRLAVLHDLAVAGDREGLLAAAKDTLAASVDDHRDCHERAAALEATTAPLAAVQHAEAPEPHWAPETPAHANQDPQTARIQALALLDAANFYDQVLTELGDAAKETPGYWTAVRDVAAGLRRRADDADPMVMSLARDGHEPDEIADMLTRPGAPAVVETGE